MYLCRKYLKLKGKLFLIPATLGGADIEEVIPKGTLNEIVKLKSFIVEELRSARRYLSLCGLKGQIDKLEMYELNEHTPVEMISSMIKPLLDGEDMGLISEAGLPAVADPGSMLVELCHKEGIEVIPLTGPSSIFLALMASGKNGQNFSFVGYLPAKNELRKAKIKDLERVANTKGQSQIFIETPYRNNSLLKDLLDILNSSTKLTIACNITMEGGFVVTKNVSQWKKMVPDLNKKPTVFII